MKSTVSTFEAKTHLSALLVQVEKGTQIIITKHGHPIAKIVPIEANDMMHKKTAIKKIQKLSAGLTLGSLNWKELRDQGRK